jgi:tRNA-specific 2-thiouridylase
MRVAAHLRIPFHTLDASAVYKQSVIDYLIREYGAGRTPNPDIMCNRDVKFGAFYDFAKAHGADFIATGHYAQARDGMLLRGADPDKDQSYFLWAIAPDALGMTLFPLGGMHKRQVRERALAYGLPNARKKDSQGICFLGPVSMDDFLRAELSTEPGAAEDTAGNSVGRHEGALLATLGERVSLTDAAPGPWYVVRKDIERNVLVVSKDRAAEVSPHGITLTDSNWFTTAAPDEVVLGQYRYHGPRVAGRIEGEAFIPADSLPEPLASGQSLVLYRDDRVLGGGIIR